MTKILVSDAPLNPRPSIRKFAPIRRPRVTIAFQLAPGLALAALLAAAATAIGQFRWLQANGISVLTVVIVLGMIVANTVPRMVPASADAGIGFAKQRLLRFGIVLYGLRLTFRDIAGVGMTGLAIDAAVLSSTFLLAWWAGTRLLGLDRTTALLIGAGSSICGAAAVMATEPVVRGRADQVTVAVATVVVFGTVAIFLYPALYHLNAHLHLFQASPATYGIYAGSTIHEVAQVAAAGRAIGEQAANTAVITKMVRVMMLAPFLVMLSAVLSWTDRGSTDGGSTGGGSTEHAGASQRIALPWFAVLFIAVAGANSLVVLPRAVQDAALGFDTFILAMAMGALGLSTRWSAIRTAGIKPLALAGLLFGWLTFGGLGINGVLHALLG